MALVMKRGSSLPPEVEIDAVRVGGEVWPMWMLVSCVRSITDRKVRGPVARQSGLLYDFTYSFFQVVQVRCWVVALLQLRKGIPAVKVGT